MPLEASSWQTRSKSKTQPHPTTGTSILATREREVTAMSARSKLDERENGKQLSMICNSFLRSWSIRDTFLILEFFITLSKETCFLYVIKVNNILLQTADREWYLE